MGDDFSGWNLQPVSPAEVGGWKLVPAEGPAQAPEGVSMTEAALHGAGQGFTMGFGDEINGGIQALGDKLRGEDASLGDLYRRNRDMFRREDKAAQDAHPVAFGATQLAASLPATFVPGLGAAKGAGLLRTMAQAGLAGGVASLGSSTADVTRGDVAGAALDTAAGAGLGAGFGAAGAGLGRLASNRLSRAAALEAQNTAKAAAAEEAVTASSRSGAGRSAQDAYKQLEHLRETGRAPHLPPEEAQAFVSLEDELGRKAQEKLLPAIAAKEQAAAKYAEDVATEAARIKARAAEQMSLGELKRQVGARAVRYGLPMAMGAVGATLGAGMGHAGAGGALGSALGMGYRPMMHSLLRLARQPVVAKPLALAAGHVASAASQGAGRLAGAASLELTPDIAAMLAALRKPKETDTSDWTAQP